MRQEFQANHRQEPEEARHDAQDSQRYPDQAQIRTVQPVQCATNGFGNSFSSRPNA